MENPNHLNEPNEAIHEENPAVPEPNQVVDIRDPNKMVDIPDDIDLVDSDEEDPEEEPEEYSEDEEVDVTPEATVRTITQKPYAIRDFPRDLFKIALLKSKDKIGEKERELLNLDMECETAERMSVLESGENATLKKRLAETETKLVWASMECDIAERRLHESRVWNKMFYMDMVRIGAVLKPPSDDEDTERPRKKSKNSTSDGIEGPFKPRGPPSDS
ncbi:hypothetical protein Tco_0392436 [Tanacetum coccineum]